MSPRSDVARLRPLLAGGLQAILLLAAVAGFADRVGLVAAVRAAWFG